MQAELTQGRFHVVQRRERLFSDLPSPTREAFEVITSVSLLPPGAIMFRERQAATGIIVLCEGRVKLSMCTESSKRFTLRVVGPGEVLGLSACLCDSPHEATAVTLETVRVAVVRRNDLLQFLREHHQACLQVVDLLSQDVHLAYDYLRSIAWGRGRRLRMARVQ